MSFVDELKRRNVIKVAIAYAVVAWLIAQVTELALDSFAAPDWAMKTVLFLLVIGFPLALFFSWAFELTPEGVKQDTGSDAIPATTAQNSKSIAVLPFESLSRDSNNDPFAAGVHDDVVTQISKIGSIKTISRTSVMQYRETTKTIPQIAAELGVATILEGGIHKAGDRVHVNVQLIDAVTDHHLWAGTYDRQLTAENIFAIQEEIATSVAEALHATLSPEQKDRLATVPTKNMAALEEYFAGRENVATRTVRTLEKAATHFERAIGFDPEFALAYVGLSDAVVLQNVYGNLPENEMLARVEPLLNKALALDENLGEAHTSLGGLRYHAKNYDDAESEFKLALELNPNYATTYHWYGTLLIDGFDRVTESFAMMSKAVELDPFSCSININLGIQHDVLGDFDAALRQYHRVVELDPEYAIVYPHIGFIYWQAHGDLVTALPWFMKGIEFSTASPNYPAYLGLLYLDLGDDSQAEYWIEKAMELGPSAYRPNIAKALFALHRGDYESMAAHAAKAMDLNPNVWWSWAALAQLRNDDLRAGRIDEACKRYELAYPALAEVEECRINRTNFRVAIDYALVLEKSGNQERAQALLDCCMSFVRTIPRMGQEGYWISDSAIYALRGDTGAALTALREAIDQGWRASWWYHLKHDPNFDSIRDEPEFQAMVKEIESDMTTQLARTHEPGANREFAAITKSVQ
jgi:TolB-like protein/Tfp pilus assembly protein PilF